MISYHLSRPDPAKPWQYAAGFKVADTDDVERITRGISRYVWSGIAWENGQRSAKNFLYSDWCVLDFDSGEMTLVEAKKLWCDSVHIIGTTKSHQVTKGDLAACDRFRVALRWERRIKDLETYHYNMYLASKAYPIDRQCKDGGRYFFPCKEIASWEKDGFTRTVSEPPASRGAPSRIFTDKGLLPPWTMRMLGTVVPIGQRNSTFFRVAKDLLRTGFDQEETSAMIADSPTYYSLSEYRSEIQRMVHSAAQSLAREEADERRREEGIDGHPR